MVPVKIQPNVGTKGCRSNIEIFTVDKPEKFD